MRQHDDRPETVAQFVREFFTGFGDIAHTVLRDDELGEVAHITHKAKGDLVIFP